MSILADQDSDFVSWLQDHGVKVAVILGVALVFTIVARVLVGRMRRRLEGAPGGTQPLNLRRTATITHAVSSFVLVLIWVVAILLILGEFNVTLAPLIAGAGVAGVALGFGAQSIVRDTLSGFFILTENQFDVGDSVEAKTTAGVVSGRVEALTLRITSLRAFDGTLHVVPNGNIQVISNKSRGWARAIVDVRIAYGEDVDGVRSIMEELFEELRKEDDIRDWLKEGPGVLGVETLADNAVVVRVIADTRPSKRFDLERRLRERIARRLDERGIKVPLPPTPTGR